MNFQQLESIWIENGGNPRWAPLMAAVALAESGGNPEAAYNTTTHLSSTRGKNPGKRGATGLWQLEWPMWARAARATSRTQLYTYNRNARVAIKAWNTGLGASNWDTPTNPAGQDPIIVQWKKAGAPRYPSPSQVHGYMKAAGIGTGSTALTTQLTAGVLKGGTGPAGTGHTVPYTTKTVTRGTHTCVWHIGGGVLGGCILNRGQVRALKGGLLVIAGGVIVFGGILLLAAVGFGSKPAQRQLQRVGLGRRTGPINIAGASASSSSAIHFNLFSTGPTTAPTASTPQSQPALGSGRDYIDVTAVTTALPSGSRALPSGRAALPRGRERRPRAKGA